MKIVQRVFLLCSLLFSQQVFSQYIVVIDENLLRQGNVQILDDLKELYSRAEIDVEFEIVSGERAVRGANNGVYQALDVRFLNNESLSDMIPVLEPIYDKHEINVYSINSFPAINTYAQLEPYIIAFPRGIQIRKRIESLVPNLQVFIAPNYSVLIDALDKNRAQMIVVSNIIVSAFFKKEDANRLIQLNEKPIEMIYSYHFVHKSQSYLAPKLARIIREMKEDGYFNRANSDND